MEEPSTRLGGGETIHRLAGFAWKTTCQNRPNKNLKDGKKLCQARAEAVLIAPLKLKKACLRSIDVGNLPSKPFTGAHVTTCEDAHSRFMAFNRVTVQSLQGGKSVLRKKLVAVVTALATIVGAGVSIPSATAESEPEFGASECGDWDVGDFEISTDRGVGIIQGFRGDGANKLAKNKFICFPDLESQIIPVIAISEDAFAREKVYEVRHWPKYLTSIGVRAFSEAKINKLPQTWPEGLVTVHASAFQSNGLATIPDYWPKNFFGFDTLAFAYNKLKKIPKEWPGNLNGIATSAFEHNELIAIPSTWPADFQGLAVEVFKQNQMKCLAYLKDHEKVSADNKKQIFDAEAFTNTDCRSSYKVKPVVQGATTTAIFDPGEFFTGTDTIKSCIVRTPVEGVTFEPVSGKVCDFKVSAKSDAPLKTTPVSVEVAPMTGDKYTVQFDLTVEKKGNSSGLNPMKGGSSEAGKTAAIIGGSFGLLALGLIVGPFVAIPGQGRDLVLKRQLISAGVPDFIADGIADWMWRVHKFTGTWMGGQGDTDYDGLTDEEERDGRMNVSFGLRPTDPFVADTDGDGIIDGVEIMRGWDPNVKN